MTEVTNSQEAVNVRESNATDPRSTKQTVYQMKSSRTAIRDSLKDSQMRNKTHEAIRHTDTLNHLNATSSDHIVLENENEISNSIAAEANQTASGPYMNIPSAMYTNSTGQIQE